MPWRIINGRTGLLTGFTSGSDGKESACNAGDLSWRDPGSTNTAWRRSRKGLLDSKRKRDSSLHSVTGHQLLIIEAQTPGEEMIKNYCKIPSFNVVLKQGNHGTNL